MAHGGEHLEGRGLLDDLPGVHHEHAVGAAGDDPHVVGDEDDRHPQLLAQAVDEVEDLRLDGDVESGGGLVGDEELRLAGERHGDHDPLAQAARELVGVGVESLAGTGHVDEREDLEGAFPGLGFRGPPVQADALGDLATDRHGGVERGQGVLEDHADVVAPDLAHLLLRQGRQSRPRRLIDPAVMWPTLGQEPHDRQPGGGLATAGLPHHTHALALVDVEGDVVHRHHRRVLQAEFGRQALDLENGGHRPPPRRARTDQFRTMSPGYLRIPSVGRTPE